MKKILIILAIAILTTQALAIKVPQDDVCTAWTDSLHYDNPPVDKLADVIESLPVKKWTDEEANVLAKMLWGEARGVQSETEKAACVWVVLNRVDDGYGDIITTVTAKYQFSGYSASNPVEEDLKALCEDVLARWYAEKDGETDVGRVLTADYLWFVGDGVHNHFRNAYNGGNRWDWSLESPYED